MGRGADALDIHMGARGVLTLLGMASLWMCLQASGYYPLSLVPYEDGVSGFTVAQAHGAYSLALLVLSLVALVLAGRVARLGEGAASRLAFALVVCVCGLAGHGLLLFFPGDASVSGRVFLGAVLVACFISLGILGYGGLTCSVGWRKGSLLVFSALILAQPLRMVELAGGSGWVHNLVFLIAPVLVAAGLVAGGAQGRHAGSPAGPMAAGDRGDCPSSNRMRPDAASDRPNPDRPSPDPSKVRGLLLPALFLVYFCIVFVRLLVTDFSGDAPSLSRLATYIASLALGLVVLVMVRFQKGDAPTTMLVALSVISVVSMAAMALMLVVQGQATAAAFIPRRVLIGFEHVAEAFVWIVAVYRAKAGYAGPDEVVRMFARYVIVVVCLPWALSFDIYYLAGLDTVISGASLLVPGVSIAFVILALALIAFLVKSVLDLRRENEAIMARRPQDSRADWVLAATGSAGLTERETQIAQFVYRGFSAGRIAEELSLSEQTVKTYTSRLYHKLGIHSKQELISLVDSAAGDRA